MQVQSESSSFSTIKSDQVVAKEKSFLDRQSRNFFQEPLLKFLLHSGGGWREITLKAYEAMVRPGYLVAYLPLPEEPLRPGGAEGDVRVCAGPLVEEGILTATIEYRQPVAEYEKFERFPPGVRYLTPPQSAVGICICHDDQVLAAAVAHAKECIQLFRPDLRCRDVHVHRGDIYIVIF